MTEKKKKKKIFFTFSFLDSSEIIKNPLRFHGSSFTLRSCLGWEEGL